MFVRYSHIGNIDADNIYILSSLYYLVKMPVR